MDVSRLIRIEYHGQPVLTTGQIADAYGCAIQSIRHNFKYNKAQFVEGVHYFFLEGDALSEFKAYVSEILANYSEDRNSTALFAPFSKMASSLYLWTKEGVVRLCKIINTKKAWEVFSLLEKAYFGTLDNSPEIEPPKIFNPEIFNRVYVFELSDGTVKIGRSANIEKRIKQIESENGVKVLRVRCSRQIPKDDAANLENSCLQHFKNSLARGNEFFNISFEDACNAIDKTPAPSNDFEKAQFLIKAAELTEDKNLRDDLIKAALNILKSA